MSREDEVHQALKAWLQVAEADRTWLRRAKWAVQTRRSGDEMGAVDAHHDPHAAPPEIYNVWIEITARGDAGLGDERGALTAALDGATIDGMTARDVRAVDSTPQRLAIRLRLHA